MSIPRRTFKAPAASAEMPSDSLADPADEVSAPAAADATSPDGEVDGPAELAGKAGGAQSCAPAPEASLELAGASAEPVAVETPPAAQTPLQRAQAELASNDADIAHLVAERNGLLLQDALDEAGIARIDADLARHQHRQKTLTDRLTILGAEQARLEVEEAARAREAKITEVEALLARRNEAADDLQRSLLAAEEAFRKVHALGLEVRNGWSWPHGRGGVLLATSSDLVMQTQSYMFKIGGRPIQTGGQHQPDVPPGFPGARCPRFEWLHTPDRLPDLAAVYREASKFASDCMRGVVPAAVTPPAATAPDDQPAQAAPAAPSVAGPNVPPLSPEIVGLLQRQFALASRSSMTQDDEREYEENGRRIQELSEMPA